MATKLVLILFVRRNIFRGGQVPLVSETTQSPTLTAHRHDNRMLIDFDVQDFLGGLAVEGLLVDCVLDGGVLALCDDG